MLKKIDGLGAFELYDNYVVGCIDEGVDVNEDYAADIYDAIQQHYMGRAIGYVSNRKNSYSSCPSVVKEILKANNVHMVAIVNYTEQQKMIFSVEKMILDTILLKSFHSLDDAEKWVTDGMALLELEKQPI